jgi:integrase
MNERILPTGSIRRPETYGRRRIRRQSMALVRKQTGKHPTCVFSFRGKPIKQVGTKAWYQALERAGIEDFRWHDLRDCWARRAQNGTPLFAMQELSGWESPEMVRRYAHLSAGRHLHPTRNAFAQYVPSR